MGQVHSAGTETAAFSGVADVVAQFEERAKERAARMSRALSRDIRAIEKYLAAHKGELSRRQIHRLQVLKNDLWDRQMEEDAKSGALEKAFGPMAAQARRDRKAGKCIPVGKAGKHFLTPQVAAAVGVGKAAKE